MPWPFTISHSWVVRLVGIARILATVSACRKVSPSSTQFIKMTLSTSELTLNSPIIDDMPIDLDLLRRLVPKMHQAPIDGRLEIDADALGIAEDLGRRLIQRNHEAALAAPGAFGDELQGHDALAGARDPDDERRARHEIPAVDQLVEPGNARRDPRGWVERGAPFALDTAGRLDASIDLEPLTVDDPERVTSQGILVAARLNDLDRPQHGALDRLDAEPQDRVGDELLGRSHGFDVGKRRLQCEHRRQVLAMQPLGKEMEGVARVPAIGLGERDETVDEEPPRAKLCGLRKEHAVGLQ